jgi:hypothetical protein
MRIIYKLNIGKFVYLLRCKSVSAILHTLHSQIYIFLFLLIRFGFYLPSSYISTHHTLHSQIFIFILFLIRFGFYLPSSCISNLFIRCLHLGVVLVPLLQQCSLLCNQLTSLSYEVGFVLLK